MTFIWLITIFLQWSSLNFKSPCCSFQWCYIGLCHRLKKIVVLAQVFKSWITLSTGLISIHRTAQIVSLTRRIRCGGIIIYTVDIDAIYQHLNNWGLVLASDKTELPILVFLDAFERSEPHPDSFCLRHQIKDMTCKRILKKVVDTN